ncbi:hypothetical protein WMY93_007905 [Mugilogobius chulae]|uniref:Uncharacterized protein n=1 Tax=Mugilogobius chulae TaxID=88201 RepID=A0AAW0PQ72_9GOBI
MFLVINGIIIHTLCSGPVFVETPRYMLLLNLVVADSITLVMSQIMYTLSNFYMILSYPLCGVLVMISIMSAHISPLTLTVMSMSATSLLQMNYYCISTGLLIGPRSKVYEMGSTITVFLFSGLAITLSFIGVMIVAFSASTDKASADKARNTLLLHMFQLSLNLMATMALPVFTDVAALTDPILAGKLFVAVYVFLVMMPRCLSALTYGLKDSSLRPILVSRLCCHLQVSANMVTAHTHDGQKKDNAPSSC